MLTKGNSGKYLTREYGRLLDKASKDRTKLSEEDLDWLDLPDDVGLGEHDPDRFKVRSDPVDPRTASSRTIDIRKRNACGDGDD